MCCTNRQMQKNQGKMPRIFQLSLFLTFPFSGGSDGKSALP